MKRALMIVLVFTLCLGLSSCVKSKTTNNVKIDYGTSTVFSDSEIKSAVNTVIKKFKDFKGCDLQKLYYDEEKSNDVVQGYMSGGKGSINGVKEENVIVLFSDFRVDSSGGDGSLNPNSTYTDWNWILIRDSKTSEWKVDGWGY